MSWSALAWAGKCRPGSASRKLVLLALADRHNDEAEGAYPSISWISDFTDLNRKTVINCLAELERAGFITDSGERRGETRQIKLYRLHLETVPKAEQSQKRNSSKSGVKQSQKRDTEPVRTSTPIGSDEPIAPKPANGVSVDHLREAWNIGPAQRGAIECRRVGPERKRKAQCFIKRYPIEDITEAIGAVARSDFLCGRGSKGFRADIEFLFSPKHMNRLLEGFYDAG